MHPASCGPVAARPEGAPRPPAALLACAALFAAALTPPLFAQDPEVPQDSQDKTIERLLEELAAERAAREALERRVSQLEGDSGDELERQLRGLVAPGDLERAPARPPSSPAFYDPAIGVFMDALLDQGNFDRRLGEDTDNFRLREVEVDMRLPISPFAEGVAILAFENQGNNEFEATVEEGYANIAVGGLTDTNIDTTMKLGRFRPMFGRNNQLHLHDWLQAVQPVAVRNLLGDEGVVGEGVLIHQPLASWEGDGGRGRALLLDLSVVNGEMFAGEETALGAAADGAGFAIESDDPIYVARVSQYSELDALSDIEFGVSAIGPLGANAVTTDVGQRVHVQYLDADVTWRSRASEHGVGSWLVQAEGMTARIDDDNGFVPDGRDSGWWVTVQRQTSLNWYVGVLFGASDVLTSEAEDQSISPYVTWYPDEFFRIRGQFEHLTRDGHGTEPDVSDANRFLLQFTWNFGAHQPHPYWVNR
jgi:hypothetical protein